MACSCDKKANVVTSKRYVVVLSGETVDQVGPSRRFLNLGSAENVRKMNPGSTIVVA